MPVTDAMVELTRRGEMKDRRSLTPPASRARAQQTEMRQHANAQCSVHFTVGTCFHPHKCANKQMGIGQF